MAYPVEAKRHSVLWWALLPLGLIALVALAVVVAVSRTIHRASLWAAERIVDWLFGLTPP